MIGDKKTIIAGDESTNMQAQTITVMNNGLGYSEVKEIVMDTFRANFIELRQQSAEIALKRAEELINKYLEVISKERLVESKIFGDPDLQYVIFEAQKQYARFGDEDIGNLLVETLVKRTLNPEISLKKITLNEALIAIPKLTMEQIDTLSLIYIFRYLNFRKEVPFSTFYYYLKPLISELKIRGDEMFYRHLEYTGCVSITAVTRTVDKIIKNVNILESERDIKQHVYKYNELYDFIDGWDKGIYISWCNLTGVGIAIAINNLKVKYNINLNIGVYIQG